MHRLYNLAKGLVVVAPHAKNSCDFAAMPSASAGRALKLLPEPLPGGDRGEGAGGRNAERVHRLADGPSCSTKRGRPFAAARIFP